MITIIEKTCQYCGKLYFTNKSQENRTHFCSDKCFRLSKRIPKVDYKCDYCGRTFQVVKRKYDELTAGKRRGLFCCQQCAKDFQKPKWEDISNLFESRGYVLLSTEYISAKEKLEYICPKHIDRGSQFITYNNLKYGYGCKYCGGERTADSRRLSFDDVKAIFDRHDMVLLEQTYQNTSKPMAYICKHHPECGVQYMLTSNAYKQHCPYCMVNKGEGAIRQYLVEHRVEYESHKTFGDLLGVGGGKLSYDFYLPNSNTLIEYQGEQHARPVDFFGGENQFAIQQEHDKRKRLYADNNGYKLLEIWYHEYTRINTILDYNLKLMA